MNKTLQPPASQYSVSFQEQRSRRSWWVWFGLLLLLTLYQGYKMLLNGGSVSDIAWIIFWIGIVATFYNERYGIYILFFFGMLADANLMRTYPFNKNFSSGESLLYLGGAFIFSPMELFIALTYLSWLGKAAMRRKLKFVMSDLFWPVIIFMAFMAYGLVYGLARGGNVNIGLWEVRPIFYLGAMFVLTSNLLTDRKHINTIFWLLTIALFIEGIAGVVFSAVKLNWDVGSVEKITEHSAAIHINTYIVLMVAAWMYKGSVARRIAMPLLAAPVLFTYVATQRRTAFLTLGMALALMGVVLFRERRRLFWLIGPPAAAFAVLYIAAFWNVEGAAGMPAQAVKAIIAPDTASAKDQSSDIYRLIENMNSAITIHTYPFTGVGFGNKFVIAVPMPDISFFDWWEYITHNSIMWIWMKTGLGGFFSMMILISLSIMTGVRATWRMPGGDMGAIALTITLFMIMHFMYAYLDMSWDNQGMLYVGVSLGILSRIEAIVDKPVPRPPPRWPWQPPPEPVPGCRPLPDKPLIPWKLW